MGAPIKKKKGRKTIPDAEFVKRLVALGGRKSELARELGVTPGAVSQRATKLAEYIKAAESVEDGAAVAAIITRSIPQMDKNQAESFAGQLENRRRQYHIFDHLEDLYTDIKVLLDGVKVEIDATRLKNRPIKPYHIDQVVKLVNQARTLITDAHDIKMDLVQAKHIEMFIQAMTSIVLKYDPEVKRKLYVELSGLGLEGQIAFVVAGERPIGSCD